VVCQWRRWSGFVYVMKKRIGKLGKKGKKKSDGEERENSNI
jgi:hypothetical protein